MALVGQSSEADIWVPVVQAPTPANWSLDNGLELLAEAVPPSGVVSMLSMAERRKCLGCRCVVLLSVEIVMSVSKDSWLGTLEGLFLNLMPCLKTLTDCFYVATPPRRTSRNTLVRSAKA